jgi:hypothetical protein
MTDLRDDQIIVFEYDDHMSREANFRCWYDLNSEEQLAWGCEPLPLAEAQGIFDRLWTKV